MALDALKLAASFALAVVSWEFCEKPVLRLKDRFPTPRPQGGFLSRTAIPSRPRRVHTRSLVPARREWGGEVGDPETIGPGRGPSGSFGELGSGPLRVVSEAVTLRMSVETLA